MAPLPRRVIRFMMAGIAVILPGCGQSPATGRDPVSAANAFFATLEKGDARAAYDSSAFGFQVTQSFESFQSNAGELGLIGGQPPVWSGTNSTEKETRLTGTVVTHSGAPLQLTVVLTPAGTNWKVFSLDTASGQGGAQPQNRFTLLGQGAGFDDVYHQPLPTMQQLTDLVHATMSKLAIAINTGDFHDFFVSISERWKQPSPNDWGGGTTETVLKRHFQGFIDQKIDLSPVANLPPVFDHPPYIDHRGLLQAQGHFDMQQYRAYFSLIYTYEMPRWRLFGIDVELRK